MTAKLRQSGVFVAGTDTGIGKTWVSIALIRCLSDAGGRVAAMKPVATGCDPTPDGLRNPDALMLQKAATVVADYELVNPYAFAPPIAPAFAAERAGVGIDPARIRHHARELASAADYLVVEGIGGWRVPIDRQYGVSDLARWLGYPIVLCVWAASITPGSAPRRLSLTACRSRDGLPIRSTPITGRWRRRWMHYVARYRRPCSAQRRGPVPARVQNQAFHSEKAQWIGSFPYSCVRASPKIAFVAAS